VCVGPGQDHYYRPEWWGAGVEQGADNSMIYSTYKLYDLHAFLFQIISFKKYFHVSLGRNFFTVLCVGPIVVGAPGQLPSLPPSVKSGRELDSALSAVELSWSAVNRA